MDALKTVAEQVIPSTQVGFTVLSISIDVPNKRGTVEVLRQDGTTETHTASLIADWAAVSADNKTVIRVFLKRIVEICLAVSDTDITGEAL